MHGGWYVSTLRFTSLTLFRTIQACTLFESGDSTLPKRTLSLRSQRCGSFGLSVLLHCLFLLFDRMQVLKKNQEGNTSVNKLFS